MRPRQGSIHRLEAIRSVLHIGAGNGDVLDDYEPCDTVTLVEPNPEAAAELRRRAAALPHVSVIPVAVAGRKAKRAMLNVCNMQELSGLHTATGILDLLPGLRVTDRFRVDTLPLREILARHATDEKGPNLLVIDAPGEEGNLLDAAVSSGMLERFQQVSVHCGRTPLFEGGADADRVIALLETHLFDLCDAVPEGAGWLRLNFRRNAALQAYRSLEAERNAMREEIAALTKAAEKQRLKLEKAQSQLASYRGMETERNGLLQEVAALSKTAEKQRLQLDEAQRQMAAGRTLCEQELARLEAQMDMIREFASPAADRTEDEAPR